MDFIKKSLTLNTPIKKGITEFGVDGDIIVPDILPDILKVLQVDGIAALTSKEISDGKMTCEGKINLKILYVPEDEESKIKSISSSFDFSHVIGNISLDENGYSDLAVDVSRIDFQLTNSRKLRIKSVIALNYAFVNTEKVDIAVDADEENVIEVNRNKTRVCNFGEFRDTQFLVRESLELPSGQSSICDLLKVDAEIYETEYKMISGRVVIKGICGICVLYTDTSNCIRYSDFEMPFTEIIELESANENSVCDIDYNVNDITYRVETDSDGDLRIVVAEVLVGVKIHAYEKMEIDYINDCYCPGKIMTFEMQKKVVDGIIAEGNITTTVRDIITPDKTCPGLSGIYNLVVKPVVENAHVENGRACVEGKLICYCLYVCSGEDVPVYSTRREIRFCENIELQGCSEGCACSVKTDVTHKNFALNSSGETEIKIALAIDVAVMKKTELPVIDGFEISDKPEMSKKGIVIYFVQCGDTIWDVAKNYTVPVSDIAALNNLESDELKCGMKLIIPSV